MALPPLVDVLAFEDWLGTPLGDDMRRAEAVLNAVSSLVRSETGRTWEDDEVPADVATVVMDVATSVFHNPTGVAQESMGSYSVSYAVSTIGLRLTQEQRSILHRYRVTQRGLWTQAVTRDDAAADTVYVPVEGGPPFPWYDSDVSA